MRYGQIRKMDIANGPGIRTTIFVTGCTHNCFNCFNKEYQDFNYGNIWTEEQTKQVIEYLSDDNVEGLTILGGEPFQNTNTLIPIVKEIKKHTDKSIWIYSGYVYEYLISKENHKELLSLCNVLVDGLFIEELKDLTLKFKGSSNQRIINLDESFIKEEIIEYYK